MENDLFTSTNFASINITGSAVSRTHIDHYITIDGVKYEYHDLHEAVDGIEDHVLTNRKMIEMLKRYGVIDNEGSSRWASSGSKGPNHAEFLKMIKAEFDKINDTSTAG